MHMPRATHMPGNTCSRHVLSTHVPVQIASLYTASAHASGGRRASLAGGFSWGFSMFVLYVVFSLGFWFGGTQIREGRITFQEMLRAFLALFYCGVWSPSSALAGVVGALPVRGAACPAAQGLPAPRGLKHAGPVRAMQPLAWPRLR